MSFIMSCTEAQTSLSDNVSYISFLFLEWPVGGKLEPVNLGLAS